MDGDYGAVATTGKSDYCHSIATRWKYTTGIFWASHLIIKSYRTMAQLLEPCVLCKRELSRCGIIRWTKLYSRYTIFQSAYLHIPHLDIDPTSELPVFYMSLLGNPQLRVRGLLYYKIVQTAPRWRALVQQTNYDHITYLLSSLRRLCGGWRTSNWHFCIYMARNLIRPNILFYFPFFSRLYLS